MSKITTQFRHSALRNGVVIRSSREYEVPDAIRQAAFIEMVNLGFKVDPEDLRGLSTQALTTMIADARNVIGADRNMRPIYPGFPKQVQDLDTITLLVEQILHYWTGGAFLPDYPDVVREGLPLEDMVRTTRDLKVLTAGEASKYFIETLTTRGVALSEDDRDLLTGSVTLAHPDVDEVKAVLSKARNGENIQTLVLALTKENILGANDAVLALAPTATNADQILRLVLAVAATPIAGKEDGFERAVQNLSDRDARTFTMVSLSRPARRALLARLGEVTDGFKADSLIARSNLWRRVMRMVHPYSIVSDQGAARRAADIIHENIAHQTLNSIVEDAMTRGDVKKVVKVLSENQPGNLLRRVVAILRLVDNDASASALADAIRTHGARSTVSTLISAYNGIIGVNDKHARITRVAGLNNSIVEADVRHIDKHYISEVAEAVKDALRAVLATKAAPQGPVGLLSKQSMPLVRRDLATTDRSMDRGERLAPVGEGDTIRVFSHWVNTSNESGYIDVGAVVLNGKFESIATVTWNSWRENRAWSTYSGDKHVRVGDNAAEYVDVNVAALKEAHPKARWVVMTLQAWSGIAFNSVDMIAGVMLRSKPNSGEVFDPRTVSTAFRPTTDAYQSIPFAVDLKTGEMVWLDSSSGSTETGVSAAQDQTVGTVVYDEIARLRMTMGEVATLWAEAHGAETKPRTSVDRDALVALLD